MTEIRPDAQISSILNNIGGFCGGTVAVLYLLNVVAVNVNIMHTLAIAAVFAGNIGFPLCNPRYFAFTRLILLWSLAGILTLGYKLPSPGLLLLTIYTLVAVVGYSTNRQATIKARLQLAIEEVAADLEASG